MLREERSRQNFFGDKPVSVSGLLPAVQILTPRTAICFPDGNAASGTLSQFGMSAGSQIVSAVAAVMHVAGFIAGEGACLTLNGGAAASLNTNASWLAGRDSTIAINNTWTLACLQSLTIRQRMNKPGSQRYWIGMTDFAAALNVATFATDAPAQQVCGFRYSPPGDGSNWKAVCQTAAANQTIVDTGIAFAITPTRFDIVPLNGGASVQFYINRALVATIGTNVPAVNTGMCAFGTGDNKNVGSQVIIDFFHCIGTFN